ncbi:MAG: serine/threonine protein phosphatase [Desulfovibrionaceae bacterium]|nr:serine/threonine protein phosphatase [Desulfovibrionaceae bacterium]
MPDLTKAFHWTAAALVAAALVSSAPCQAGAAQPDRPAQAPAARTQKAAGTVYDGQPDFTEKELLQFCRTLPDFRSWVKASGEKPHPVMKNGKPDFAYSAKAAEWARFHGWDEKRFFCVMGRSAAALALVSEGRDRAARYRDMPKVSDAEFELVQTHLGELLKAGSGQEPPQKQAAPAKK